MGVYFDPLRLSQRSTSLRQIAPPASFGPIVSVDKADINIADLTLGPLYCVPLALIAILRSGTKKHSESALRKIAFRSVSQCILDASPNSKLIPHLR